MEYPNLSFYARAFLIGSIIAPATLASASIVHSQPNQLNIAGSSMRAPVWMHRVADTRHDGAPNFADLAEKVQPAVIGVVSRTAATRKVLPGQPFQFGVPDQRTPNDEDEEKMPDSDGSGSAQKPNTREAVAVGSGFFISSDGYAVTNSHVVEHNKTVQIRTNDNKTYQARVVGADSLSDLALLKVDGRADFSYVRLADQPPRVGEWILTAGSPFGLGGTVTAGIVSAREREIGTGASEGFIQIDAPINTGDSGGPSFNTSGEVIGVNSMIVSPSGGWAGVAFAVPADTAKSVIPQLKDKGSVTRGSMQAEVQSVTPEIADSLGMSNPHGAIVANVRSDGPAAKGGLKSGDVITSVDGQPIKTANDLTKKIHAMSPGSSIRVAMIRNGQESSLNVTLDRLPDQSESSSPDPG